MTSIRVPSTLTAEVESEYLPESGMRYWIVLRFGWHVIERFEWMSDWAPEEPEVDQFIGERIAAVLKGAGDEG